jgi:hypothetical protein
LHCRCNLHDLISNGLDIFLMTNFLVHSMRRIVK